MEMSKELKEYMEKLPEIKDISIDISEPNSSVTIYEGDFIIKNELFEILVSGFIKYDWLPNSGVHFYGKSFVELDILVKIVESKSLIIIISGVEFCKGFITNTSYEDLHTDLYIEGIASKDVVYGDKTIAVNKLKFSIPNLRDFRGSVVKRTTKSNIKTSTSRLVLENEKYIITIDKCHDYDKRQKSLIGKGGFHILYSGELISKKNSIFYTDIDDIIGCLNIFLSFLNGRRTSALFIQGVFENDNIWCDYSSYYVDSYKAVNSWANRRNVNGIDKMWIKFSELWKDKDNRNFLTSIIHWYVESNGQVGSSEGSIVMAQTGLELIYNWWIIENKRLIVGKDSETITASNKIRLLLSQINIDHSVPKSLNFLQEYITNGVNIIDAPEAIVQIRNAIVHSREEKRKKLSEINSMAKYQALQLCIWYIEMSLLCILEFDGKYENRCSDVRSALEAEELVPWIKEGSKKI